MVLLKMSMEISLPKMGELLVMMMTMISPSGREVPSMKSLRQKAKVLLPKFRLEIMALHPEYPPLRASLADPAYCQPGKLVYSSQKNGFAGRF